MTLVRIIGFLPQFLPPHFASRDCHHHYTHSHIFIDIYTLQEVATNAMGAERLMAQLLMTSTYKYIFAHKIKHYFAVVICVCQNIGALHFITAQI